MLKGNIEFRPLVSGAARNNDELLALNKIRKSIGLLAVSSDFNSDEIAPITVGLEGTFDTKSETAAIRNSFLGRILGKVSDNPFYVVDGAAGALSKADMKFVVSEKSAKFVSNLEFGSVKSLIVPFKQERADVVIAKANAVYLTSIFQYLRYLLDNRVGYKRFTEDDFTSYTVAYEGEHLKASVVVKKGEVVEAKYSDAFATIVLLDAKKQYVRPIAFFSSMKYETLSLGRGLADLTHRPIKTVSKSTDNETLLRFQSQVGFYKTLDEFRQAHPEKDIDWILQKHYYVVKPNEFDRVMALLEKFHTLALDTETTGLNFTFRCEQGRGDNIVGLILSPKEGYSFYFPLAHSHRSDIVNLPNGKVGEPTREEIKTFLNTHFKKMLETKGIVCHNTEFDWGVLWSYGISMNVVFDTMVAFRLSLVNAGLLSSYSLKYLSNEILNRNSIELDDLKRDGEFEPSVDGWTFADLNEELVRCYAGPDGCNTISLYNWVKSTKLIEKYNLKMLIDIETQFQKVLSYAKYYGMHVNKQDGAALVAKMELRRTELLQAWYTEIEKLGGSRVNAKGVLLNPDSPTDKAYAFYTVAKCGEIETFKTDKGSLQVNDAALKIWSKKRNPDGSAKVPMAEIFLELSEVGKVMKSFLSNMDEVTDEDGFFHSGYHLLNTGRISTSKPNYQGFNDTVKKDITARDGYFIVDYDYSSIESRIIASLSGQTNLRDSMFDPNTDWHRIQASLMFNTPYELVQPDMRQKVKPINFGLPYGMSPIGLAESLYGVSNKETQALAEQDIERYFKPQPFVRSFFENLRKNAWEKGYSETFFGRRRYYNKATKSRGSIEREGGNAPIQGFGADVYKRQSGLFFKELEKRGWLGKVLIVGFVHDEGILEVSRDIDFGELFEVMVNTLEFHWDGFCPFFIGCGFGNSWYEAKKTEIPVELQHELAKDSRELTELVRSDMTNTEMNKWLVERIARFNREFVQQAFFDKANDETAIKDIVNSRLTEVLLDNGVDKKAIGDMLLSDKITKFGEIIGEKVPITLYTPEEYVKKYGTGNSEDSKTIQSKSKDELKREVVFNYVDELGYYLDQEREALFVNIRFLQELQKPLFSAYFVPKGTSGSYQLFIVDTTDKKFYGGKARFKLVGLPILKQALIKLV